jgi:hypothetical protein
VLRYLKDIRRLAIYGTTTVSDDEGCVVISPEEFDETAKSF